MKFIIIKNCKEFENEITDIFKQLVGSNLNVKIVNNDYVAYLNYEHNQDLIDIIYAFENSFMTSICAYISNDKDEDRLQEEERIAIKLLDSLNHGVYTLKTALLENPRINFQKEILDYILNHTNISIDFIKEFVKYDLNVSLASKSMFIHRNTMMYKLDKLKSESGFDLRNFKDAYILYMLITTK